MISKNCLVMYVYNDITTDARVQRAADALANDFDLTLISSQRGKIIQEKNYKNILVGGHHLGALNYFESIFAAWRVIHKICPDVVYCHDYFSTLLAYILIRIKFPCKIIYDAHELIIPEKKKKDKRLRFFYWFEKRIVHKVDLLICASMERGIIMQDHYQLNTAPLVINNISQLSLSNDGTTKTILQSLDSFFSKPGTTVVYAGVVSKKRRIEDLYYALTSLAPECKLLIVGDGDALQELKERAAHNNKLVTAFTGSIPYQSLGSILACCDIGFLFYPVDYLNNIYCASNKIYEYASVNLPILANDNPTVKLILEKNQIGISTNVLVDGISQLRGKSEYYKNNCETFSHTYPWEKEARVLKRSVMTIADRIKH